MSVATVNLALCTEIQIKTQKCRNAVFCCCRKPKSKKQKNKKKEEDEVSIPDFTLLDAPFVDVSFSLTPEEIEKSDFYVFNPDLRYLIVQGPNLHKKYMSISKVVGLRIAETNLPEMLERFLTSLYEDTLKDNHLQLQMFWENNIYLLNTYPIKNNKSKIVGGMLTCTHSCPSLQDVSRFRLEK